MSQLQDKYPLMLERILFASKLWVKPQSAPNGSRIRPWL